MRTFICFITCFILSWSSLIDAKPAELQPVDVRDKMREIMQSHAIYHTFTSQLAQRSLCNFINTLDPSKCYFLENEVQPWIHMDDMALQQVVKQFGKAQFPAFEAIIVQYKRAIERRRAYEKRSESEDLPIRILAKEFKDVPWAKTEEELYIRIQRLRAMQRDVVAKLGKEAQDAALQRFHKRRTLTEDEILCSDKALAQKVFCTYVLKALAASLDSNTMYFTPTEASQLLIDLEQRLFGIGVMFQDDIDGFSVVKIVKGGPADRSKQLRVKDKIIGVNGELVMGLDIMDVVGMIRGAENTPVVLRVVRNADLDEKQKLEPFDVTIVRGEIVLEDTRCESYGVPFGKGQIAYLRLHSFYQDNETSSTSDLIKAFHEIRKRGPVEGVVLDLRFNPGGILSQAVSVAGLFLKRGIVVSIKDEHHEVYHLRNLEDPPMWEGPLVVLMNRASASAAEIVAQSLKDYGRAIICGDDHSYGKGSFQTFTFSTHGGSSVDPKGEYKVTRGCYYTVSGKTPQLVGVTSDVLVPGGLSFLDVGESYSKYPLQNDFIPPNFQDSLSDLSFYKRDQVRKLYQMSMQTPMSYYQTFLDQLRKNSQIRLEQNKLYQSFIAEIKKNDVSFDEMDAVDRYPDFQFQEGLDVMRDLILLIMEQNDFLHVQKQEKIAA